MALHQLDIFTTNYGNVQVILWSDDGGGAGALSARQQCPRQACKLRL
jgi:hypothetical protein